MSGGMSCGMSICQICGTTERTLHCITHDRLFDFGEKYRYWRCAHCDAIYLDPQPNWAERMRHYQADYRGYHYVESERSALQRWGMNYGLHKRLRIVRSAGLARERTLELLDVGCGSGNFVDWVAAKTAWRATGVERVDLLFGAHHQPQTNILQSDLHALGIRDKSVDVVTLWTVLEHLADPLAGLVEAARVLRKDGVLVVRTVCHQSWAAKLFGPNWVGLDAPRVLFAFAPRSLEVLFNKAGFRIESSGSYFHDFHPYQWSIRNLVSSQIKSERVRNLLVRAAGSWPSRLLTFPFFACQTWQMRNSFVTLIARPI